MKFDIEYIRKVTIQYIAMLFTLFTFLVVETMVAFAKGEIDTLRLWILVILAISFLTLGGLLTLLWGIKKKPKEETF